MKHAVHFSIAAFVLIGFAATNLLGVGVTVFRDDFNRADSSTIGSVSGPGTGTWTETNVGDGNVDISANLLRVVHGDTDGPSYITVPYAGIGINPQLNLNPGTTTWNFNMQSGRAALSGFGTTSNGIAYILGATGTNVQNGAGVAGYAVLWGESGNDPIKFVRFLNGIQGTLTPLITPTLVPFDNIGTGFLSVRVAYNSTTNNWDLFGRDDGATAFADPATGTLSLLGSVVNSTNTGATMSVLGAYGQYTTLATANVYRFDNFSIEVPEPCSIGLVFVVAALHRRRRA